MILDSFKDYLRLIKGSGNNELYLKKKFDFVQTEDFSQKIAKYKNCNKCMLSQIKSDFFYGYGNQKAKLFIVYGMITEKGIITGESSDESVLLLSNMLKAINIKRSDIYTTSFIKCCVKSIKRKALPTEIISCLPYLEEQIKLINPKILLLVGKQVFASLLKTTEPIEILRKKDLFYKNIKTFVSLNPSELISNPSLKRPAWEDLKKLQSCYL